MSDQHWRDRAAKNVSRETLERLDIFASLLKKWTKSINLVAPSTVSELWGRHIIDSLQVLDVAPVSTTWADMGSGGGLPGAVVAIAAAEKAPGMAVTLIESDQRKAAFLRAVARETRVGFKVLNERIEIAEPQAADILSARALAPLSVLLEYFERHGHSKSTGLFQKGETWRKEVEDARKIWHFDCEATDSETREGSAVLKIEGVARV